MAVTQISRIQHRRGLQQDLPQLAPAELGWSVDTQKLYIGNGTLEEGAPQTGVTEILTSMSVTNLASLLGTYTFVGDVAGSAAQTGTSAINPTIRSYQGKLDDIVNIKDFGATGNGIDDDTVAINRALQQIYKSGISEIDPRTRRIIHFPAGTYLISSSIKVPPFAVLIGDGVQSTIVTINVGNQPAITLCDSLFQTGINIGINSALTPQFIGFNRMQVTTSNTSRQQPLMTVDSASSLNFVNVGFFGSQSTGFYANLINILSTSVNSRDITFDNCGFINSGNGISVIDGGVSSLRVTNSTFESLSNTAIILGSCNGFTSIGNYYGNVTASLTRNSTNTNNDVSLGDSYFSVTGGISSVKKTGLNFGGFQITTGSLTTVSATPTIIPVTGNIGVKLNYDISNSSARRNGTLIFNVNSGSSTAIFSDEYAETATGFGANVFVTPTSVIFSINAGIANMKYNYELFE